MFIGHFALGFAAKRAVPRVSLGALFLACQLADLLWPNLVLLGLESFAVVPGYTAMTPLRFDSYPYSHSLLGMVIWGALFAAGYAALSRAGTRVALWIVALVASHWVLDFVTHAPDMPLTFWTTDKVGLGLWNHPTAELVIEVALYAAGVSVYVLTTRARDRIGSAALWALVAALGIVYVANVLGPPPPSVAAVAWSAQAMWLFVLWAYWVDRHRAPT
jgi:membrane-bound metal-dependent hydrolase YbcI (DUF457 family)